MDIALTVSNREISPAVVNLFQFENNTTTLNFTLDSYMHGEVDLRNYKAYGITSINGQIDMTELTATYDSAKDKLVLSWDVKEFTLRQEGAILYQICFKENANDGEGTGVFYSYKGVMVNRESIDADNHLTANYPTLLKQWLDRINELAGTLEAGIVYIPYGETIPASERLSGRLYFQFVDSANTKGRFEDHECNELKLNEFNNYLSRHGGQMMGHIYKNADNSFFMISGGSKGNAGVNGASLVVNGKDNGGNFYLYAGDGTNIATLYGSPAGLFIWNGKHIVRSVNNAQADTNGNVNIDVGVTTVNGKKGALTPADTGCLPLSGGKMTGSVDMNNNVINKLRELNLNGSENGGVVDFHYAGSTDDYTSRIIEDAEGKISIIAPNGFKVNNKDMVRSVDGVVADNAGNVNTNAVKLTGDETVAGTKTFTSPTRKTTSLERGVVPSANTNVQAMQFMDKNSKVLGELEYFYGTNGKNGMSLLLYDSSGNRGAALRIGQNSDGTTYASAPTPASTSNSTDLATTAWVNNAAVHKTGDETVAGAKKFTGRMTLESANNEIKFINPNNSAFAGFVRATSTGFAIGTQKDGVWNKTIVFTDTTITAPTPASTSNNTEIATTAWANDKFLPLAGGTMSGAITRSGQLLAKRNVNDSYLEFFGATTYLNGAYLRLDGKDSSGRQGQFTLATGDGSKNITLNGKPDGSLTWNSIDISAMSMPSGAYKNLDLGATGTSYTAPADGWYALKMTNMGGSTTVAMINNFNGLEDRKDCMTANAIQAVYMPAKKGQTVRVEYTSGKASLFRFVYAEGQKHLKA